MEIDLRDDATARLHAMALLLDSIAALHNAGLISHEKAFEKSNCYLDHVDEVLKQNNLE